MNWDALGAIGEIIGAIGVVTSLFYVAYQVKQNTTQSKLNTDAITASNAEAVNRTANDIRLRIAESESLTRIWVAGLKDPSALSEEDLARFRFTMTSALHNAQFVFEASGLGINHQQWAPTQSIVVRLISSPGGKWLWENYSTDFSSSFREEVGRLFDQGRIGDAET